MLRKKNTQPSEQMLEKLWLFGNALNTVGELYMQLYFEISGEARQRATVETEQPANSKKKSAEPPVKRRRRRRHNIKKAKLGRPRTKTPAVLVEQQQVNGHLSSY